ncbi:cell division protein ZapE [Marinomonas ostreistagni]|uniref:cell division protein ZapE n=1 Tax=Marinomonas ostreistagni TaxID=359209 RepID=UPI0019512690|nr:cell division protein ZapE [Marinomonas ostreistagni]MBM6551745.1 AFG1 family ATPase [Marinomonas ostreistagni]
MSQSPFTLYQTRVSQGRIEHSEAQQAALSALNDLWVRLTAQQASSSSVSPLGVYLWGSVGRGKTMLMDLFFASLPAGVGRRQHFHHFMAALHKELNTTFGVANPLQQIAARMAREVKVICFDEFFVNDIADAMLLGNLIQALFEEGVHLVATSNIPVVELFQNQLQKQRFAPTIALMSEHLEVFHVTGDKDYRFRLPIELPVYFESFRALQEQVLSQLFAAQDAVLGELKVNHRPLEFQAKNPHALWCHFDELCEKPRSSQDYMSLAQQFDTLVISHIPELSSEPYEQIKARGTEDSALGSGATGERRVALGIHDDAVRRFISLVDECYDQGVCVIFQAQCPLDQLYQNGVLTFEFRRTYSRISEMQTQGYHLRQTSTQ